MIRWVAAILLAAVLALTSAPSEPPPPPPKPDTLGAVNFTSWWHDEYDSPQASRSLERLAAAGARSLALIATQYQDTPESSWVAADRERTPSDNALRAIAARARALGLQVRLRLLVDVRSGAPRVTISPADPAAWFASYEEVVRHYAALARELGAEGLEIGAELKGVSAQADGWRRVVAVARSQFGGRLSYAANWDEFEQVTWWDALDEIGVDAWFPLARSPAPPEESVVAAWAPYLDALSAVAARWGRPVVLSELGYSSSVGALIEPWRRGARYSAEEQVTGLRAAFRALAGRDWLRAVYLWQWSADPDAGGSGDTDHTIQGKPAEEVVRAWLQDRR